MLRPARLWLSGAIALSLGCGEAAPPADPEIRVRVQMVALDEHDSPVVILEEEDGSRLLPIWIGTAEASSIAAQINNRPPPRPNSHDLARSLIQELEAKVERVVVTELRGGTYYALLSLLRDGRRFDIDVRPSDGIAVALRAHAPILVRASVFARAGEPAVAGGDERSIHWLPPSPPASGRQPATPQLEL
jgi:bifunctional DNase/RNase